MVHRVAERVANELAAAVEPAYAPRLINDIEKRPGETEIDPVDLRIALV